MVSSVTVLILFAVLLCCSAESFQATCNFKDSSRARRGRSGRGGRGGRGAVGKRPMSKPALYGVKTASIDVVAMAQADDTLTAYVNGQSSDSWTTIDCNGMVKVPGKLYGGDVVSFVVQNFGGDHAFNAAIVSADGSQVYTATGLTGWKSVPYSQAGDGWMLPGFDDSDWPEMTDSKSGCGVKEELKSAGSKSMWSDEDSVQIAVRFEVPAPTTDCSCNEGECPDGTCHFCLFDQGDNRKVCYKDWTQEACVAEGDPPYTWCGDV